VKTLLFIRGISLYIILTDSGERESRPFSEEPKTHLYFNWHLVLHLDILHGFLRTQHCRHVHNHYWPGVFNLLKFDHTPKKMSLTFLCLQAIWCL